MKEVSEERVIKLLEELVAKQDELLGKMAKATGTAIREASKEETEEYLKYVRSKLHGNGDYPYPRRNH
jgi:hypothetical protein